MKKNLSIFAVCGLGSSECDCGESLDRIAGFGGLPGGSKRYMVDEELTSKVIGCAMAVHRELGPQSCLTKTQIPAPMKEFTGYRVLLADDEEIDLDIVSHIVEDLGAECVKVRDGEEMLEVLNGPDGGKIDLVQ